MGYSKRSSNYPERITLYNPTHMMSMADPIAIGVETLRIDSGWSLEKEFIELICMNPWMVLYLIVNQVDSCHDCVCHDSCHDCHDCDLIHQRHRVDGWSCFDYDLRIPSHGISKMSYIGYNMKSTNMIVWSIWDHPPSVFEEIDSRNEMRWNPWPR